MWIHVDSSCFYRFDNSSQKENVWSEGSPLQGLKAIGSVQSCCKQQHPLAKSAGTVLSKGSEITHIRRLALEFRSRSWSSLSEHIPKLPCCMIFPKSSSNDHLLEVNPYANLQIHVGISIPILSISILSPWCFPFPMISHISWKVYLVSSRQELVTTSLANLRAACDATTAVRQRCCRPNRPPGPLKRRMAGHTGQYGGYDGYEIRKIWNKDRLEVPKNLKWRIPKSPRVSRLKWSYWWFGSTPILENLHIGNIKSVDLMGYHSDLWTHPFVSRWLDASLVPRRLAACRWFSSLSKRCGQGCGGGS